MLYVLALVVLFTTLATELAARRGWLPYWITRKLLHIIAVGACAVATLVIDRTALTWMVAGAEVLLIALIFSNQLMREESGRRAWGIIWFPLAFLALLISPVPRPIVAFAMWTLALCDPAATVVGKLFAQRTYSLTGDAKSLAGNVAFGFTFLLLALIFTVPAQVTASPEAEQFRLSVVQLIGWPGIIGMAILLSIGESLGSRGLDNLIVPLLAAYLWYGVDPEQYVLLVPLLFGGALFSLWMVLRKSLTVGGALTATLLGIGVVLGSHSFWWLVPLFIFLFSSSLIGKLLPATTAAGDAKQKLPRDATQVLANGAVYGWFALFAWPKEGIVYLLYPQTESWLIAIMAIATADTWSSEIGQYFKAPTYDLVRWQQVPVGISGGVSLPGTLAGLAGATCLVGTCFWLIPHVTVTTCGMLILIGFLGMLIDSALGSLLQAKYQDINTGALSDTPGPDKTLARSFHWITNDLVNFLAILLGVWLAVNIL